MSNYPKPDSRFASAKVAKAQRARDRADRRETMRLKSAQLKSEIEHMHLFGHECSLSAEQLAELRERVKHRPWRASW